MSDDERRGEDVAGLFRKFGGDAKGYREFAPEPQMHEPTPSWRLVSGARPGAAASPAAAVAAPAPVPVANPAPVATPVPAAAAPVKSLFSRPVAAAPVRAVAPQPAVAPAPQVQSPAASSGLSFATKPVQPEPPAAAPAMAVRELDTLFARLNGEPPPQAPEPGGAGLLSRWRRPS